MASLVALLRAVLQQQHLSSRGPVCPVPALSFPQRVRLWSQASGGTPGHAYKKDKDLVACVPLLSAARCKSSAFVAQQDAWRCDARGGGCIGNGYVFCRTLDFQVLAQAQTIADVVFCGKPSACNTVSASGMRLSTDMRCVDDSTAPRPPLDFFL